MPHANMKRATEIRKSLVKRILIVNNSADIYGASRCVLRLVSRLDRARFQPVVVVPEEGPLLDLLKELNVECHLFKGLGVIDRATIKSKRIAGFLLSLPIQIVRFARMIKRLKIDLVHTNTAVILVPGPAALLSGKPHIWHIREFFSEFGPFWQIHDLVMRSLSCRIVAISKAVAAQFANGEKVSVVYDGIDLAAHTAIEASAAQDFRRENGLEGRLVVGCVGRIKLQRKGQEVLLQAATRLKELALPVSYLIVGSPFAGNESHLDVLREYVREQSLQDQVLFAGEMADPRPAFSAMDVLVLPSAQPEPFGLVIQEAMAFGVPVVTTGIGGAAEQVEDGVSGFHVPPNDPDAMAMALKRLLTDRELREEMGRAARKRVEQHFTIDRTVSNISEIYESCLA